MMPQLVLSPLVKWTLATLGGAAAIHWIVTEVRRINDELDQVRVVPDAEALARQALPTLRRDPRTGEYRVM
jgi:hypothetical protein